MNVDIELDTESREESVPPDLAEALDRAVDARRFLDRLSYSNKRRFVMGIEDARTEETRQRRGTADNVTEQTQPM